MDCTNDTIVSPGCAVDESVIPSILSVLSTGDNNTDQPYPDDEMISNSSIHGERQRRVPSSSRVRLRSSPRASPAISHSLTPDTEESSAFSSTAGVINQAAQSLYDETSGIMSRTRDDVNILTRRLMNAVSSSVEDDKTTISSPKHQQQQQHASPSKSTASSTRARIRKAADQATIVASSTFPPLSPTHNTQNNNNYPYDKNSSSSGLNPYNNKSSALNMFSYSPKRSPPSTRSSVEHNKLRQQDSLLSIETPPSLPSRTAQTRSPVEFEEEEEDLPRQSRSNHNNSRTHNLIHRIPLRDHSSPTTTKNEEEDNIRHHRDGDNHNIDHHTTLRLASSFASKQSELSTHKILVTRSYEVKEHVLESIFYVSTSAILGSIVRTYLARLFGMDCELQDFVNDFLTPLSRKICVTNGGRTLQTGGALFYDFPANVLGSFILGLITPTEQRSRFPWLHRDHALQRDDVFHASLGTGFCGCLTTFASWNTQMVVMLDGTYCELGSQVVAVLFGYMVGLMGATCGFQFGRQCGLWMHNFRHAGEDNGMADNKDEEALFDENVTPLYREPQTHHHQGVELVDDDEVKLQPVPNHLHKIPLFFAAAVLLGAFLVGNLVQDIQFYRGMTLLWCVAPLGSLVRWRLSGFNLTEGKVWCFNLPKWVPWGTFMANMLAVFTAALLTGIDDRYFPTNDPMESSWPLGLLFALISGFAGSLSTVSTFIKETVLLSEEHVGVAKAHYYAVGTCVCGMILGLAVYATTIRA